MIKERHFKEQKYYSLIYLKETFSWEDILLMEVRGLLELFDDSAKFTFVGVISIRNIAFMVFPKVIKEISPSDVFLTLKTLRRYSFKNSQLFDGVDYFSIYPDDPDCSELSIAQYLLNDYENNGLYSTQEQFYSLNGDGAVNWVNTIENLDPVFSNRQPIYADTFNHVVLNIDDNFIIEIHKWSLGYCRDKFFHFLNNDVVLQFDFERNVHSLGTTVDLLRILYKQLSISYVDREVHLLKSLIYLIRKRAGSIKNDLSLYGTKNFAGVWESICKNTIGASLDVKTIFPSPEWNLLGNQYKSKGTLIPDIVHFDLDRARNYLFDAKYYSLKYSEGIAGEPGYKDILKQFQYQQHIEKKKQERVSNAFLFPVDDTEFESLKINPAVIDVNEFIVAIGSIQYALFEQKTIWILMCSYSKWQKMYLENKTINSDCLYWKA